MAEVDVVPGRIGGWAWRCTACGPAPVAWVDHTLAAYDALGHASTHHSLPLPSET